MKRIFPGPAGILLEDESLLTSTQIFTQTQFTTITNFQEGPWKNMSKDVQTQNSNNYLYNIFNINWIKKQTEKQQSAVVHKVPFLAGILISLDKTTEQKHNFVNVALKDLTGTIRGNMTIKVYQKYLTHLTIGCVLVLINSRILSCSCNSCDNFHLTITQKNLAAIYNNNNEKLTLQQFQSAEILKSEFSSSILDCDNTNKNSISSEKKLLYTFKKNTTFVPNNNIQKIEEEDTKNNVKKIKLYNATDDDEETLLWKETLADLDLETFFNEDI